ncbi:hypothetical protein [Saccharopolyspora phatthalungensis]|uniref:Holin n=1 Tax=Saccharopolyspora phatthalungensis TaxID=664693 RepID=A0A840QIG2_9PSEU|nr:hypothetical protein [Saccharopolyspora phatthalungensis]MBB5159910.1 hypothetical protein [Saccharopolyspora phatthalungensis]
MSEHTSPSEPMLSQVEPAAVAEGARMVLGTFVALGWITIDSTTINAIITGVSAVASVALTIWTRRRVTPAARPRDADRTALVPAPPSTRLAE